MKADFHKLLAPMFVAALLAACGGGGGGNKAEPAPPAPPKPPGLPSQTAVGAWIGINDALVTLPTTVNGARFIRSRDRNCNLVNYSVCTSGQVNTLTGATVTDTAATTTAAAYYWLEKDGTASSPLAVNTRRFSERIGHTALFFNNRYWVIGGGYQNSAGARSDVWSSLDGKSWELETNTAAFGSRWLHQSVVFNGKMWVIGGINSAGQIANNVYSSTDGINWTQVALSTPFTTWTHEDLNVAVFNNVMWAIYDGSVYSSTDGVGWTLRIPNGFAVRRGYASLTAYNNKLWYIGGGFGFPGASAVAVNDVWSTTDGLNWQQVNSNAAFAPRFRHGAFVLNNRLWVFGGQGLTGGTVAAPTPDAWSTTDGLTWQQEATNTEIDQSSFGQFVQGTNKVTLIGGILRGWSNRVWQTTDGSNWSDLSPYAQFSPRVTARAVSFLGDMWLLGGAVTESVDTNEVWKSSDGLNWTRVTTVGSIFSPRDAHQVTVFNNRIWVIGGWDNLASVRGTETRLNDVWSSADGVNWTRDTAAAQFSPRQEFALGVFNGRMWVIGGNVATNTTVNDVWSSLDGVTWIQATPAAAFTSRAGHRAAAIGSGLYVIGGQTNGSGVATDKLWASVDGAVWTQVTPAGASFSARSFPSVAQHNGRVWVLGGSDGTAPLNDVWSTADGVNWLQHTPAAQFSPRSSAALISHNNELWAIAGITQFNRQNDVWRSVDGVSWRVGFTHTISTP